MKITSIALALLTTLAACDKPAPEPAPGTASSSDTTTDTSTSTGSSSTTTTTTSADEPSGTTGGHVCDKVGVPCDLAGDAGCGPGLACLPTGPGEPGVCAAPCSVDQPCEVGTCDGQLGMCRDSDGLPTGLCPGLPQCAGQQCDSACGGGLSCVLGECALACESVADCPAGATTCAVGVCFDGDGLLDPCEE